jgi:hypothetical protein
MLNPGSGASAHDTHASLRFAATTVENVPMGHGVQAAAPAELL